MLKSTYLAVALALFLGSAAMAAPAPWLLSWSAAPVAPDPNPSVRAQLNPSFQDQTLRQVVRLSAGGERVRIRLSNEYGAAPLKVGAVHVALAADQGAIQPGSDRAVTFGGSPTAVIPPGAPLLSDPIELKTAPLTSLAVSLYLPGSTGPCTCHDQGTQTGLVSDKGDFTAARQFPTQSTINFRAFLSGIEVMPDRPGKTVVVLGDSISDGVGATQDRNDRWPDLLAERLAKHAGGPWAVANMGISGNRMLLDIAGQSAPARFDRDVLATPGVAYVVVFEGVNDLGVALGSHENPQLSAAEMIAGYRQLIARAHAAGIRIYGATILPYEGAGYWTPEGEAVRLAINAWARTSGEYDAVLDFDAALRDPAKPSTIKDGLHMGDHLHGNPAGYRALADSVDLNLFR
jgi:lysophospholipase L1-like esterase